MIRIIGIGSPFGDDAAGLIAARRLAVAPPPDTEVIEADRPGATLIELLAGVDAAILIDAAHSGAPTGTLHDLDLHDLPRQTIALVSSHGLGVIDAVQLACALGHAPTRGRVLAIEVATERVERSDVDIQPRNLSAAVDAAVERAVRRARRWVEQLRTASIQSCESCVD
jgi:hydrogenase maturation protease